MTLEGTVRNGVVILDGRHGLADGTRVRVVVEEEPDDEPTLAGLLELAGTVDDLPPDMARNHDRYLHGQLTKPRIIGTRTPEDQRQRVCDILGQAFDTDQPDLAARHDEHHP